MYSARWFRPWSPAIVVGFLWAMSGTPVARAGETTSPESGGKPIPAELSGLHDRWQAALDEFSVPGFAVVVTRDDQVIYLDTFGYRDLEKKLPVTPATAYYIASCTKPFNAMALLTLVESGKVGLDDPVQKYLPRFALPKPAESDAITIRDLLCHRPGIECAPAVFLDAYTGEITDERYFRLLRERGSTAGKPSYSNIHYTLIGRVIEAAGGRPWRDYLAEHIFRPTGMSGATGYADEMYGRPDVALPYEIAETGLAPVSNRKTNATMHAAGGLGMSITDVGRWLRLNINGGEIDGKRVISADHAALMQSVQAESAQGQIRVIQGFGLGWMVGTFRKGGPKYCMHTGGYVGACAHMSFLPEKKIGVGVLTNCGAPGAIFAESVVSIDVLDRFVGGEHPDFMEDLRAGMKRNLPKMRRDAARAAQAASVVDEGALSLPPESYCGEFRADLFGTLRVERENASFRIQIGALRTPFVRCEHDAFTLLIGDAARDGHFESADGKVKAIVIELESGAVRFTRP